MSQAPWDRPEAAGAWDAFVAGHPQGHFLQSSAWARLRSAQGWVAKRVALEGPAGAMAGAQALVHGSPLGSFAYVARGPTCSPGAEAWPALLEALQGALGPGCVALRLEPNWPDTPGNRQLLVASGLVESEPTQPPSTVRISLVPDEDELLAGMKQKWRYNVRLAERHGVAVSLGGEADLGVFERLMDVTARRDGFPRRREGYYADVCRAFWPGNARLHVARLGGEALAAILVIQFGTTATYLYGASSGAHREAMPNHALQWAAMRLARSEGCRVYDLWGIPDAVGLAARDGARPDAVPAGHGGLWGVWQFKRGFGGRVWRSVGAWDRVYAPVRYRLAVGGARGLQRWLARARRP